MIERDFLAAAASLIRGFADGAEQQAADHTFTGVELAQLLRGCADELEKPETAQKLSEASRG